MWKSTILLFCLSGYCCAGPAMIKRNMPIMQRDDEPMAMEPAAAAAEEIKPEDPIAPELPFMSTLTLPSNATSIRADITDNFSCDNKTYGYYADVENDCQIFHVCLPVTYADGKENTFRWSFICPEETVFSQESFTCMRREDMTIECEESFKYYELNRNFGTIEEEPIKQTPSVKKPMSTNSKPQPEMTMPMPMESEQPMEAEMPMSKPHVQPMKEEKQPMKETKKPMANRRKPAHTAMVNKKKPATIVEQPLRSKTEKPVEEEVVPNVDKVMVKPLNNQRFTKRPTTALKDKVQTSKPQQVVVPNRGELFNQIRKRPITFNKKDATVVVKPTEEKEEVEKEEQEEVEKTEEEPVKIAEPMLEEPEPTLKLETIFTPVTAVPVEETENVALEPIATTVDEVAVPENVAEASETAEVFVKPAEEETVMPEKTNEEVIQTEVQQQTKTTAAEAEKGANMTEVEKEETETAEVKKEEVKETTKTIEAMTDKEAQLPVTNPEPIPSETAESMPEAPKEQEDIKVIDAVKSIPDKDKTEQAVQPLEAIEEIPAVILEVEEQKPIAATEEFKTKVDAAMKVKSNPAETLANEKDMPAESSIVPSDNTSDVLTPSLEELEEAKPVNVMETMDASPDMLTQNPGVEDMFSNTNSLKESSGGFKPVDPVMAAEAEALISDFLNTLMKSENSNNKPIYPGEHHIDTAETTNIQTEVSNEEEKPEMSMTNEMKVEETPTAVEDIEAQKLKNGAAVSNMLMLHSLPDNMYQIPVQVITTSEEKEEVKTNEEENNSVEENILEADKVEQDNMDVASAVKLNTEVLTTPVESAPQVAMDNLPQENTETNEPIKMEDLNIPSYSPLSIDDIVELVKERLDQVPTAEKQITVETQVASEEQAPAETSNTQKSEEIIMPIYHRVSPLPAESNLLKAQNLLVNEPTSIDKENLATSTTLQETEAMKPQLEDETKESMQPTMAEKLVKTDQTVPATEEQKQSRAYRSRSMKNAKMDPRKRRFLFRSDASS